MNIHYSKVIVIFVICSLFSFAHGAKVDSRVLGDPVNSKVKVNKKSKRDIDQLYMLVLEGNPLATYKGNLVSLSATSISVNHQNKVNKSNTLNVHSTESRQYLAHLARQQSSVLKLVKSTLKRNILVKNNYHIALNAFSLELTQDENKALQAVEGIKQVVKIKKRYLTSDSGPSYIKAASAWQGSAIGVSSMGENVIVGILDTGISPFHPSFADVGGDKYDHNNPLGQGVYLGDCAKPELTYYCNDKLIGIWSHPDILLNYTPNGDDLIAIDHDGHGSHTTSIAAGNILNDVPVYNVVGELAAFSFPKISGVAPHANIVSYQVCAANEGCFPDITALAVEHAIANGVQVLNYSVGGEATDPWYDIESQVFLAAREAGIHVATSAGNAGPNSATVGSPGNAPWLTSVAAYRHDRFFTEKEITFNGGNTTLSTILGLASTLGHSAAIVDAAHFGDGDCLNEFTEGTFNGEIVLCRRGGIARVSKGSNVLVGGAGAMVLVNVAGEVDNLVSDFHVLPAIHINAEDGNNLVNWLASGNNHQAKISASVMEHNESVARIAGSFSSRGPEKIINKWLVPHISAPGVNIYGANSEYQPWYGVNEKTESPYIFLDGTSMASPHVAGALVLITSLRPQWTPAEVQSALMLSANFDTKKEDGETASSFFDSGAGFLHIDRALNAGLVMDVSYQDYIDANGENEGDASSLNLPSALRTDCTLKCTWMREFTATEQSSWIASSDSTTSGFSISVNPTNFILAKGESVILEITGSVSEGYQDEYGMGRLILTPDNNQLSVTALPIIGHFRLGEFPLNYRIDTSKDVGHSNVSGIKTIGTDNLQITTFELTEVEVIKAEIPRDDLDSSSWPRNVYNDPSYFYAQSLIIPEGIKRVVARVSSTTSPDLDLYITTDYNLNGRLDSIYEMQTDICNTATAKALESCEINNPLAGQYSLTVHNYGDFDNPIAVEDLVTIELVLIGQDDRSITVEHKNKVAALEDIDLDINWSKDLVENTLYMTVIELGTDASTPDDIGIMPVEIYRNARPIALINNKRKITITAEEGSSISLTALASLNANPFSPLVFHWRQLSGPEITFNNSNKMDLSFTLPDVTNNNVANIELIVSQSGVDSLPASVSINISKKEVKKGGVNTASYLLFLGLLTWYRRSFRGRS